MHLILHLIKHCCQAKKIQDPNPLLDIPMSYLQKTNTRLETLEVVERAGWLAYFTSYHDWHSDDGWKKKDDILNATQLSTFSFYKDMLW